MRKTLSLSLHAANRMLEREVPVEALDLLQLAVPLLNTKPLEVKFLKARIAVVARLAEDGRPRIISAWRLDSKKAA